MEGSEYKCSIGRNVSDFEKEEQRVIALKESQKAARWWLRNAEHILYSCVYVIGANNKIGFSNAYDKMECGRHFVCRGLQNGNRSGWTENCSRGSKGVWEYGRK